MYNIRIVDFKRLAGTVNSKCSLVGIHIDGMSVLCADIIKRQMASVYMEAYVVKESLSKNTCNVGMTAYGTLFQFDRLYEKLCMQSRLVKTVGEEIKKVVDDRINCSLWSMEWKDKSMPVGGKTYVMGILNATPDSFSDGGSYNTVESAVERVIEMAGHGADIIDVGGESTRPGHQPVPLDEELRRVVPVIKSAVKKTVLPISIDTTKAEVASQALKAGAHAVNDIWGLKKDPEIAAVAAEYNAGLIIMHNKNNTGYQDIMTDIIRFLYNSVDAALKAGVNLKNIAVDPGIGFGKTVEQNLCVMQNLNMLKIIGLPVLIGTSRKSMIGKTLNLDVNKRLFGTAATVAFGISKGADIVRVHDVKKMREVADMTDAMSRHKGV